MPSLNLRWKDTAESRKIVYYTMVAEKHFSFAWVFPHALRWSPAASGARAS